jgi:hypothetical protein
MRAALMARVVRRDGFRAAQNTCDCASVIEAALTGDLYGPRHLDAEHLRQIVARQHLRHRRISAEESMTVAPSAVTAAVDAERHLSETR